MKSRKKYPLIIIPVLCFLMILSGLFALVLQAAAPRPVDIAGAYKPQEERTEEEIISAELNYEYEQKRTQTLIIAPTVIVVSFAADIAYFAVIHRRNKTNKEDS